jgi:Ca-activated chloride channel family protein
MTVGIKRNKTPLLCKEGRSRREAGGGVVGKDAKPPYRCQRSAPFFHGFFTISIALICTIIPTQSQTIKVNVSLQQVTATVTDSDGKLITDLNPDDFIVELGGTPQQIADFTRDTNIPVSVGLVLDTSTSMEATVAAAKAAASTFIGGMQPRDESFLLTFDTATNVRQGFTHDPSKLFSALDAVSIGGGTALIGGVTEAAKKMEQAVNRKHALIVISDGGDSRAAEAEVLKFHDLIPSLETLIYAVQVQDINFATAYAMSAPTPNAKTLPLVTAAYRPDLAHKLMETMADQTGGRYFYIDVTGKRSQVAHELSDDFQEIFAELRAQYTIGFYPPSGAEGIKVRVRTVNPNYHVRTSSPQLGPALDSDDDSYENVLQTAQGAEQHGQHAQAIQALQRAARLNESDPRAFRSLGKIYVLTGDYRKAFEALNNLQSVTVLTGEDHFLFGLTLLELNDAGAAQSHLIESVLLTPDYPPAYLQLSAAYMKLNKPQDALATLEDYLKRFPDDPEHASAVERANKLRAIVKP